MTFLLRNRQSGYCIDIPESDARSGKEVIGYPHIHYGPNQLWFWESGQIVSCQDSSLCLGISQDASARSTTVKLTPRSHPISHWIYKGGCFQLAAKPSLYLAANGAHVTLCESSELSIWDLDYFNTKRHCVPKPACSCHLRYGPLSQNDVNSSWQLECTVNVEQSADCTYFCVVGWGPGGYSGIQQIDSKRRVAIFSMWNNEVGRVEELAHGKGVVVSDFGGEGTGLKAMKDFDWKENQDVTFLVKGEVETSRPDQGKLNGLETWFGLPWICSCWFLTGGQKYLMASYKRVSKQRPLSTNGFYSFVEDWKRCEGSEGFKMCRRATFKNPKISTNGTSRFLTKAEFTKVEQGLDAYAKDIAFGGLNNDKRSFFLQTGCDPECSDSIPNVPCGKQLEASS